MQAEKKERCRVCAGLGVTDLVSFWVGTLIFRRKNEEFFGKTVIPAARGEEQAFV